MAAGGAVALIEQFLVPLVGNTVLAAVKDKFATTLWTGGPTVQSVLTGSRMPSPAAAASRSTPAFPGITALVTGLLSTLATGVKLPITSTLNLYLANDAGRLGVRIQGSEDSPSAIST